MSAQSACRCAILMVGTAVLFAGASLWAQVTVQISGTAMDQTGAALPGIEITATQTDTGFKRTAISDETGSYLLTQLPVGPYRLEAAKPGFRTYVQTGIVLQVGANPTIPIVLEVGEVAETIEVQADTAQVETRAMGVGAVVDNQRIVQLPLNGRNPTDLIALAGAAVQTGSSPAWAVKTGVNISVAGGQTYGVAYLLDGAQHSNFYDATGMPLPFPDALQEFKVETGALAAENGVHSGATVNGVTKSGTNTIHGDVFEFLRNDFFNARNFFSARRESLKRNQLGGTLGGPIKKDKVFFFGGYQGTLIRQLSSDGTAFVPTAREMTGDFSAFMNNPACGTAGRHLAAPFINDKVDPPSLSPAALKIANKFPATSDPVCGRTTFNERNVENDHQFVGRVDYTLNPKHSVFARYLGTLYRNDTPYDLSGGNILTVAAITGSTVQNYGQNDLATSVTLGDTYLISADTVNSFRVAFNRDSGNHGGPHHFGPSDVGINAYGSVPGSISMTAPGLFSLSPGAGPYLHIDVTMLQLNNDVSMVRGAHQFAFGGSVANSLVDGLAFVFSQGIYTFTGQQTGNGMADFLTGRLSGFRQQTPNGLFEYQRFLALYAQDTWKLNRRLTVNYGLRWEPFFPMQMKDQHIYNFSLDRFNQGIVSKVYTNAPPGFYYPGDTGFNGNASIQSQWRNTDPRIGFAVDPGGDGRMSIRGSGGMAYDFVNEQLHHNTVGASPFGGQLIIPSASLDNPYTGFGTPFPYVSNPRNARFQPFGSFQPVPPELKTPVIYSWNLALQRQVTPGWFVSASYVGNHAIHMLTATELDPPVFLGFGPCTLYTVTGNTVTPSPQTVCSTQANENQRRLLYLQNPVAAQNISFITQYESSGTQSYNGLLLNSTFRAGRTLNMNANYTWSHCIGDQTNGNAVPNPGANYIHIDNRRLDRGNCAQDRRHLLNVTAVAQTPQFRNGTLRTIGTGWTMSAIYAYRSGAPLYVNSGLDNSLTGFTTTNQRPDLVNAHVRASNAGSACVGVVNCISWLDINAFAQPALGTLGNVGAYSIFGPGYWQLDMAISRDFRVREGQTLQIRAEGFNVPNSMRPQNPNVGLNAGATFGRIFAAYDPRIIQFALKYAF
jgi:hypothetical protein